MPSIVDFKSLPNHRQIAIDSQRADASCFFDQFEAAPAAVKAAFELTTQWNDSLAMVRSNIPFHHFNVVRTLGLPAPVNDATFADINTFYGGKKHWIVVASGETEPVDLESELVSRQYQKSGSWDRVLLQAATPDLESQWAELSKGAEMVSTENIEEWSSLIVKCYEMPDIVGDWLKSFVGRQGWFHSILRDADSGKAVMARSLYFHKESGWSWLGIDAPVPGVMAPCFDDDKKVTAALLLAAYQAGARDFVSDVEATSDDMKGPDYDKWHELGFFTAYHRLLYSKE